MPTAETAKTHKNIMKYACSDDNINTCAKIRRKKYKVDDLWGENIKKLRAKRQTQRPPIVGVEKQRLRATRGGGWRYFRAGNSFLLLFFFFLAHNRLSTRIDKHIQTTFPLTPRPSPSKRVMHEPNIHTLHKRNHRGWTHCLHRNPPPKIMTDQ